MWAWGITNNKEKEVLALPLESRSPSLGIEKLDVPIPELNDDEVLIQTKASALNFNTLWSSICYPIPPSQLIRNFVTRNSDSKDHIKDFAIFGSDCSGIITRVGSSVKNWKEGDEVTVHCNITNVNDPISQKDGMLSNAQSIWGYETNYGAFAEYAKVKSSQLLRKPSKLSWVESCSYGLTLSTAYRMLISENGASIRPGEVCLIWGAAGGLGVFAIQLCKMIGAKCIAVVSDSYKAEICKNLGADLVIDRSQETFGPFIDETENFNYINWRKAKKIIERKGFKEIDVVFEHIGKSTLAASIYFLRRGGRVVICAASSGYESKIDLRYLWMELKTIIGSHFANYHEAFQSSELIEKGLIKPVIGSTSGIDELPEVADKMYANKSVGKNVFKH